MPTYHSSIESITTRQQRSQKKTAGTPSIPVNIPRAQNKIGNAKLSQNHPSPTSPSPIKPNDPSHTKKFT